METLSVLTDSDILASSDTQLLLEALRECHGQFFKNLSRMAAIVRRLDELGVEVAIENSMLSYVRLIAHGQLSQSLFATWHCEPKLLECARQLPIPLQEKIADNEALKVMGLDGDHRMVRPGDMTQAEMKQVFAGKRLRTDAEQVGWLRERMQKIAAKSQPKEGPGVTLDRRRKGIVANGLFIHLTELASYVSSLSR